MQVVKRSCLCVSRWTQWIFIQLFNKGLAYQAEVPVNWCPALGTVLANEEIIDGKSERGDHPVVRMPMKQVQTALQQLQHCIKIAAKANIVTAINLLVHPLGMLGSHLRKGTAVH